MVLFFRFEHAKVCSCVQAMNDVLEEEEEESIRRSYVKLDVTLAVGEAQVGAVEV